MTLAVRPDNDLRGDSIVIIFGFRSFDEGEYFTRIRLHPAACIGAAVLLWCCPDRDSGTTTECLKCLVGEFSCDYGCDEGV